MSKESNVPWLVGGGVALLALGGGGYIWYQSNQTAQQRQAELAEKLRKAEEDSRLAALREATARAEALARVPVAAPVAQAPAPAPPAPAPGAFDPLGGIINTVGGAIKGVTDFFKGFKLF